MNAEGAKALGYLLQEIAKSERENGIEINFAGAWVQVGGVMLTLDHDADGNVIARPT